MSDLRTCPLSLNGGQVSSFNILFFIWPPFCAYWVFDPWSIAMAHVLFIQFSFWLRYHNTNEIGRIRTQDLLVSCQPLQPQLGSWEILTLRYPGSIVWKFVHFQESMTSSATSGLWPQGWSFRKSRRAPTSTSRKPCQETRARTTRCLVPFCQLTNLCCLKKPLSQIMVQYNLKLHLWALSKVAKLSSVCYAEVLRACLLF